MEARRKRGNYSQESLANALKMIKQSGSSLEAAKRFGIPYATLRRKFVENVPGKTYGNFSLISR